MRYLDIAVTYRICIESRMRFEDICESILNIKDFFSAARLHFFMVMIFLRLSIVESIMYLEERTLFVLFQKD